LNKPAQGNERSDALVALNADQKKRLATYARFMSHGTGDEANDLLQGAFARWLASKKPVEGPEQTYKFLSQAISSIRSNIFRHEKVVRRFEGIRVIAQEDDEDDSVEQAPDPAACTEATVFFQQLYDLCADDEEIQFLLLAQMKSGTPAEIQADLGWDDKKYKSVQKRKRRLVIRWTLEGKLK